MKYASEDLMNEHEGILFGLKILERMVGLIKSGTQIETEDLKEIIEFLRLFADKCHHGKEEGLLFPAMEEAGIPKEHGPIGQMLLEHEEGRKHLAGMAEAVRTERFDKKLFEQAATDYISLLRSHIQKENTVLFPLGDKRVPLETQAELLVAFEDYEERVMGAGTHEKLHELPHRLEAKYLSAEKRV